MSKISLDKTSWELVEVLKETTKKNLLVNKVAKNSKSVKKNNKK
mgnify:CR=1 FL=1